LNIFFVLGHRSAELQVRPQGNFIQCRESEKYLHKGKTQSSREKFTRRNYICWDEFSQGKKMQSSREKSSGDSKVMGHKKKKFVHMAKK
jgi:hypothetical protein